MILYHAVTNYHILCCLLHKVLYNKDKKGVLYISSLNFDRKDTERLIKQTGIFTDVKIIDEYYDYQALKKEKKVNNMVNLICNYMEANNKINFRDYTEYYICGDQYSLGMYLVTKRIQYNYFEEACGILSQCETVENNIKKLSKEHYKIVRQLGLLGNSSMVVKRYGDLSKQIEGYINEKDVDFSIARILEELTEEDRDKIISIFIGNIQDESDNNKKKDVLLTQHFINLNRMTYKEQKNIYTLLVDYFNKRNKLIIKPHPSDIHGLYKQWFPESIVLSRSLQSELLPYCIKGELETAITVSSTAVLGLKNVKNVIDFDAEVEKLYLNINRYYITLKILQLILEKKDEKLYLFGCYKKFITNLAKIDNIKLPELVELENIEHIEKTGSRRIYIVDDLSILSETPRTSYIEFQKELDENDIVIYINSNRKQYFYNEKQLSLLKNISVVVVDKKKLKEDVSDCLVEKDYLFVYSKNNLIKELINNMQEKIVLKNTGIELNIDQKDNIQMKMLEGVLVSTEERLLETVKNNKKLKEENEKLKKQNKEIKESYSWKMTKPLRIIKKGITKK